MKRFLSSLFYFLVPIAIIAYPLDYAISHLLGRSNKKPGEIEVWNDLYNSKVNCDVVIYGSSRAWVHFDPQIISDSLNVSAYNLGIDGHNFWMQYLRHLVLLKYNKKPKTIILSLDIYTLQKRRDLYLPEQFLPYMLWNKDIREYTSSYIGYKMFDYYIPLIRYGGRFQALNTSLELLLRGVPEKGYRKNGFLGQDLEWNKDFEIAKQNQVSYEIEFDKKTLILFENFILECKNMNIDLVLVYSPEYFEGQSFVLNRNDAINFFYNFSYKYNLPFYDFSKDEISFEKRLFYNAGHLNNFGAEKFTKKLTRYLKARKH